VLSLTGWLLLLAPCASPKGNEMSKPNRNSILECRDCGFAVHIKHATDSRCPECHDSYGKECAADEEEVDDEAVARKARFDALYAGMDFFSIAGDIAQAGSTTIPLIRLTRRQDS
jgi:hypothetical protein